MKKSLTLVLAIAMVFTMFASVAFAADATTTASTDAQTKFDALKAAGIMTGTVVDGQVVAGLDLNMDRASFAEVLVNLYNLPKVATTSSFSDVPNDHWALQQIEAAKAAGYMLGNGDGTFNPDGKITLQELASALDEANGLNAVANADVVGADDWAKGYVAAAINAKLLASASDYTAAATRADLVVGTYQTYENVQAEQAPTATFSATGASQITVTFNKAIDKTKATFAVKKGSLPINISSTTVADDNMSATLNLATKLTKGDYTVTVANPELSGTVTVADDEKVAKITFTSDKAPVDRTVSTTAYGFLKIYNQYNEDVTASKYSEITFADPTHQTLDNTGKITITSSSDFVLDSKIAVSALDPNGTFASTILTISPAAQAATLSIEKLVNTADDTAVLEAGSTAADFKLVVTAKDQYGNDVSASDLKEDVMASVVSSTTGLDVDRYTTIADNGKPKFVSLDVDNDGTQELTLALSGTPAAGTAQVLLISKTTGNKATFDLTVKEAVKVDTLSLSAPDVAVAGETFEVPFTAVDQFGNAITDATTLNNLNISGTISNVDRIDTSAPAVTAAFEPDYVNDTAVLKVNTSNINTATFGTTAKSLFLTTVTGTNKVATITISLQPAAKPSVVTGVTDDTMKAIAVNADTTISLDNVNVLDQYNREHTADYYAGYKVSVTTSDKNVVKLTGASAAGDNASATLTSANQDVTVHGQAKGTATITLSLVDSSNAPVVGSDVTFNVKVVDLASITGYSVGDIPTLYATDDAAYHTNTVDINGLLADGTKVGLTNDGTYYSVTADTYGTGIHYSGGTIYADSTALSAGADDITIPVTVVGQLSSGSKVISKTVTVSVAASKAKTVALNADSSIVTKESDGVISVSLTKIGSGAGKVADFTALAKEAVVTTDQYGVELTAAKEKLSAIATNLPDGVSVLTDAQAGDEFNITAITDNGLVSQFKVVVTQ